MTLNISDKTKTKQVFICHVWHTQACLCHRFNYYDVALLLIHLKKKIQVDITFNMFPRVGSRDLKEGYKALSSGNQVEILIGQKMDQTHRLYMKTNKTKANICEREKTKWPDCQNKKYWLWGLSWRSRILLGGPWNPWNFTQFLCRCRRLRVVGQSFQYFLTRAHH